MPEKEQVAARLSASAAAEYKAHPIVARLKKTIKARGWTLEDVSPRLNPPVTPATLSRALSGKHRLDPRYYHQILDIVGEPISLFWKRYYESVADLEHPGLNDWEPAPVLRLVSGQPETGAPQPVASLIAQSLPELERDPLDSLPPKLRELDDLRMQDPSEAYKQCLEWIADCVQRLRKKGKLRRPVLAELLTALGAFASVLRSRGENHLAANILAVAFESIDNSRSGPILAWLLWRSAPILTDAGYPSLALAYLRQASHIFSTFGLHLDETGVDFSAGIVLATFMADFKSSRLCFEKSLATGAEARDEGYCLLALTNLAKLAELSGRPEEAIEQIERLEAAMKGGMSGRLQTMTRWIKAQAIADSGELETAAELLGGQRVAVAQFCPPIDFCLHFFDYASVLIRLGEMGRLKTAANVALEHLSDIDLESAVMKKASRALDRLAEGSVRPSELKNWRKKLAKSKSVNPPGL